MTAHKSKTSTLRGKNGSLIKTMSSGQHFPTVQHDHCNVNAQVTHSSNLDVIDYALQLTHLLHIGQIISKQTDGVANYFCQEIKRITQGRVQLILRLKISEEDQLTLHTVLLTFPVQFGSSVYGTLYIASDLHDPSLPALPVNVAELFALVCSWFLYILEQSTFLQQQYQRLDILFEEALTNREREVLSLMCQGYDQDKIADILCISPKTVGKHRQYIYEQLGTHNEHDTILAGYQMGLFSL